MSASTVQAQPPRVKSIGELASRFAALHHLFGVSVERVVNDPLSGVDFVIVLVAEVSEALGDCVKSWALGLMVQRVVGVGPIDDPAEQHESGIACQLVFLQDCLE